MATKVMLEAIARRLKMPIELEGFSIPYSFYLADRPHQELDETKTLAENGVA